MKSHFFYFFLDKITFSVNMESENLLNWSGEARKGNK